MNRRFQKAEEKRAKAEQQAADSVGINVYKMRYIGVLISGFLGGLGGIVYITAGVSEWKFENGVAGFALYFAIHFNAPWWLCLLLDRIDSCTVRIVSCIV